MNTPEPIVDDIQINPDPTAPPLDTAPPALPVSAPTEEELFEVKVAGKTFKVPRSEVVSGYQRQQDYTRKTMEAAEQRKAWEAERQQVYARVEELKTWLSNPANLQTYLQQVTQQRGYEDPNSPLTAAQAEHLVQARFAQQQQILDQKLSQKEVEIEQRQQAQSYLQDLNATVKGLLDTHSELKSIDGIDALLYKDVAAMQPGSLDDAKAMFATAAKARADKLQAHFTELQKRSATQTAKLQRGIEPPGGAGVPAAPSQTFKRLGDPDLLKSVVDELMASDTT